MARGLKNFRYSTTSPYSSVTFSSLRLGRSRLKMRSPWATTNLPCLISVNIRPSLSLIMAETANEPSSFLSIVRTSTSLILITGRGKTSVNAIPLLPRNNKSALSLTSEQLTGGTGSLAGYNVPSRRDSSYLFPSFTIPEMAPIVRGGSGCLDSFCQFISGAWRLGPTQRKAAQAGAPSTRDRACVRQARDAA